MTSELAAVFSRRADYVSWWVKRARQLRLEQVSWADRMDDLDERLGARYDEPGNPQ